MWLRLRQIALVARELAPVERDLVEVLGVRLAHRDPGVRRFGLENALFPVGNEILEVVAPVQEGTAAGRYLRRRGGDGGYMVITQCDDLAPRRTRVEALGVRVVHAFETEHFRNMQLHPRDTGGTFFEIDEQLGSGAHEPDGPWAPAGPDWRGGRDTNRVLGIVGAEVQCDEPERVAARWSEIAEIELELREGAGGPGVPVLPLRNAAVRFVPCTDGRPEGLGGIDVRAADPAAILAAAQTRRLRTGDRQVVLCGTRVNLLDAPR